eukprot:GHUV01028721.1.p2 GENE.GHUV01028721.1~~GHUV01028721.1.p2  ORF type:complete len:122 (+),score=44.79 GHUV01028721.1:944-1309(+)
MLNHSNSALAPSSKMHTSSSSRTHALRHHFGTLWQLVNKNSSSSSRGRRLSGPCSSRTPHGVSRVIVGAASSKSKYSSDLVRSVRAMPIKLISVSKGNSKAATAMAQEWITKLARQVHWRD